MKKKTVVSKRKQKITNTFGDEIETMNISMPIMAGDTVMGAIELSKDVTNETQRKNKILKIEKDIFNHSIKYLNRFESDKARYELDSIISNNDMISNIKHQIGRMKNAKAPVFIYGETGTGKELFAHSIHNASDRKDKPFISQNCAAIPENLLESILFGTVKGSYTGAVDAPGLFELADGGTLFLDEINSMPISLQSKMLRVLENGDQKW